MKAYEFPAHVTAEGHLEGPEALMDRLPHGGPLRVIVLVPESDEVDGGKSWAQMAQQQFLAGYAEADTIYDDLDQVE